MERGVQRKLHAPCEWGKSLRQKARGLPIHIRPVRLYWIRRYAQALLLSHRRGVVSFQRPVAGSKQHPCSRLNNLLWLGWWWRSRPCGDCGILWWQYCLHHRGECQWCGEAAELCRGGSENTGIRNLFIKLKQEKWSALCLFSLSTFSILCVSSGVIPLQ